MYPYLLLVEACTVLCHFQEWLLFFPQPVIPFRYSDSNIVVVEVEKGAHSVLTASIEIVTGKTDNERKAP